MTTKQTTLKQHLAPAEAKASEPKDLAHFLNDPKIKSQIALALPKHMTAERLARIGTTLLRTNPALMQCDRTSFLGAIMQTAQLGLEPGSALGHAYLIPFNVNRKVGNQWQKVKECQLIIGYRGMLDLARRSGQILSIEARVIYAKDRYEIEMGIDSSLKHWPAWHETDRGEVLFFYAVAKLRDGGTQFEVMSAAEVNKIRDNSQGYQQAKTKAAEKNKAIESPWATNYEEMGKKTVTRRLFKWLPVSIELQTAVGLDEMGDANINQNNGALIDAEFTIESNDDAPSHDDEQTDAQLIHDALASATSEDALNDAWDRSRDASLSSEETTSLLELYKKRLAELTA